MSNLHLYWQGKITDGVPKSNVFTRLGKIILKIQIAYWSFQFKRQAKVSGNGLQVLGPSLVYGTGIIEIGANLVIRSRGHNIVEIFVAPNAKLEIGNNVFINQGVRIVCTTNIRIGDGCLLGDECVLVDNDYHGVGKSPSKSAPIRLEHGSWLATRVIVLRGVTIGEKSVIGAGSVVTKSIPAGVVAAGSPARIIGSLDLE